MGKILGLQQMSYPELVLAGNSDKSRTCQGNSALSLLCVKADAAAAPIRWPQ